MRENNDDENDVIENENENVNENIKNENSLLSDSSTIEKLTEVNRDPTVYKIDDMDLSPDTQNAKKILGDELINEVKEYTLLNYEEEHLRNRYRGFFTLMTPQEIMVHQKNLLKKPLTNLPSSLNDTAVQLFKNLVSYMGDRRSSKGANLHILKHTKIAMSSPEELKDEAYLQVIKQITNNPNDESKEKGWIFFAIMASIYPPSMELYYGLINYLLKIIDTESDDNLKKKANYIAIRLMKTFESKRRYSPSLDEMNYISQMKPITVEINFFSGAATTMQVESYTTIKDLKTSVMKKLHLNINRIPYYALYEICYKPDCIEERYLSENYKVCDVLSVWDKEKEDFKEKEEHKKKEKDKDKDKEKELEIKFKIFLKIQLYYNYNPEDLDSVTMHYVQTNFEVIKGFYRLSVDDTNILAAIQFFINYGNISDDDIKRHVNTEIRKYIPCNKLFLIGDGEVTPEKIISIYKSFKFKSKLEAKNKYLDILKKNELWETTQFSCLYSHKYNNENTNSLRIENPDHIPENCVVCISPKEVIITDEDRNIVLKMKYKYLASWGVNGDLFVIVKKQDKSFNKMYFESSQSQLFKILMDSYAGILAGKNMVDIMFQTAETCKMFETLPVAKSKTGESIRSRQSTIYSIDEP